MRKCRRVSFERQNIIRTQLMAIIQFNVFRLDFDLVFDTFLSRANDFINVDVRINLFGEQLIDKNSLRSTREIIQLVLTFFKF